MATNQYFNNFAYAREQDLVEDLTIESIKMYGQDMKYLPRTRVNTDHLYGEDDLSTFDEGIDIEELELELIDFGVIELSKSENEISITARFEDFGSIQKELERRKIEISSSEFEREAITTRDISKSTRKRIRSTRDERRATR